VAAEGLDLRRAERVVHYDLPWTPMRLEQREGRAVRLGSNHERVEVVRFVPPPVVDAALRLNERLSRKAALPGRAGLGPDGVRLWRWRSALADRLGAGAALRGTAVVRASPPGWASPATPSVLAGFELLRRGRAPPSRSPRRWGGSTRKACGARRRRSSRRSCWRLRVTSGSRPPSRRRWLARSID